MLPSSESDVTVAWLTASDVFLRALYIPSPTVSDVLEGDGGRELMSSSVCRSLNNNDSNNNDDEGENMIILITMKGEIMLMTTMIMTKTTTTTKTNKKKTK